MQASLIQINHAKYKGSILPQFLTSSRPVWQVDKVIAEYVNRPGEFWNSAPVIFYDSSRAVLYAEKLGIFFKCLQKIYDTYN